MIDALAERPPAAVSAPPRDPVFESWLAGGFVWLPEKGMGWYPIREREYGEEYFQKYVGYSRTAMGRVITAARVDLVQRHTGPGIAPDLCDVGIGCGAFVDAMPGSWGFDVNPAGERWLRERHRYASPYFDAFDALTFWDSLEHIRNPAPVLRNARRWVFVSLPIFSGPDHTLASYHFRKDEHWWYWTATGFVAWMAEHGFECVEHNEMETAAGRLDIHSFAFRRVA